MALTPSEALVEALCNRSFLSLWSFANPLARRGRELCDVLVVCDPDVIVFSVKDIGLRDAADPDAVARWRRKAIDASVEQLYGATRHLAAGRAVLRADGSTEVAVVPVERHRIHRVAVALGSGGDVTFGQGDFRKGFVHVLDDRSLRVVMEELDTITDFADYLRAKEALVESGTRLVLSGGEPDLLAVYLDGDRRFPTGSDLLLVEEGTWDDVTSRAEWARRKAADRESYIWDFLIEHVGSTVLGPGLAFGDAESAERTMRVMARESRFGRRVLGAAFNEFMALAAAKRVRARVVPSPAESRYVFLASGREEPRDTRTQELLLRCIVVRSTMHVPAPVVGLATERHEPGEGFSLDAALVDIPVWSEDYQLKAEAIQRELGYFASPLLSTAAEDEYPASSDGT